jgi:hypothetical protein
MAELDQDLHDHGQLEIQAVIKRVAATHLGGELPDIEAELERQLRAAGHWPQPRPWLRAVGLEMADGRVYIVTKHAYSNPRGH